MEDKQGNTRTTVWLPKKLYEDFQKKYGTRKLSGFVKEMIEYDLMGDKPDLIDREIEKLQTANESKIKYLLSQKKSAEKKQQKKAITNDIANNFEIWDYRTAIPPKKDDSKPSKGGDK